MFCCSAPRAAGPPSRGTRAGAPGPRTPRSRRAAREPPTPASSKPRLNSAAARALRAHRLGRKWRGLRCAGARRGYRLRRDVRLREAHGHLHRQAALMDALFHSVMASTSVRRASHGSPKLERLRNTCVVSFCDSKLVTTFSSRSRRRYSRSRRAGLALRRRAWWLHLGRLPR